MAQPRPLIPTVLQPRDRRRDRRRQLAGRGRMVALGSAAGVALLLVGIVVVRLIGGPGPGGDGRSVTLSQASDAARTPTPAPTDTPTASDSPTTATDAGPTSSVEATPATTTRTTTPRTAAPSTRASSTPKTTKTTKTAPATATPRPTGAVTAGQVFGPVHSGSYHLGPVEWSGSIHNSCEPYPASVQKVEGQYLAGADQSLNGDGSLCDATALVTTRLGKTIMVRIVTTGTSNAPGDLDLSPAAYQAIHQDDPQGTTANPRPMTWQLVKSPDTGPIMLQYQTDANKWWTSLWVRNPRLPVTSVEVQPAGSAGFTALQRGGDGSWTLDSGFGPGGFTLRITAQDGQTISPTFPSFTPGAVVTTDQQFH